MGDGKDEDCVCEEPGQTKFYETKGFAQPQPSYLPGNLVFSCTNPPPGEAPQRSPDNWFAGYGGVAQNPLYRTTANDYGGGLPDVHTTPTTFTGKSNAFSQHLGDCGMFRDHGLNTSINKARVPEH